MQLLPRPSTNCPPYLQSHASQISLLVPANCLKPYHCTNHHHHLSPKKLSTPVTQPPTPALIMFPHFSFLVPVYPPACVYCAVLCMYCYIPQPVGVTLGCESSSICQWNHSAEVMGRFGYDQWWIYINIYNVAFTSIETWLNFAYVLIINIYWIKFRQCSNSFTQLVFACSSRTISQSTAYKFLYYVYTMQYNYARGCNITSVGSELDN